jgi:hypothetical protein
MNYTQFTVHSSRPVRVTEGNKKGIDGREMLDATNQWNSTKVLGSLVDYYIITFRAAFGTVVRSNND